MDTAYPDLDTIWPGWKIEKLIGNGLGGSVYKAVRSVNGIVMESAVKTVIAPKTQYSFARPQVEGVQASDTELYKSKADDGITEISCLLKLKSCRHVVRIEDYALVKREDEIQWDVYIRMELLRSLTDYLLERQRLHEDEIIKLGSDLSEVLMQCERAGIIHRDIKLEKLPS